MVRELNKRTLSKGILEMKFMKKTKEKIEMEIENTDGHDTMYGNNISSAMKEAKIIYVSEPSIIACKDLRPGRLSFGGINPEIEKIMEEESAEKQSKMMEEPADISNSQLAKVYSKNKKFHPYSKQNKNQVMKRKFECDLPPRGKSDMFPNPFKRQKRGKQRK